MIILRRVIELGTFVFIAELFEDKPNGYRIDITHVSPELHWVEYKQDILEAVFYFRNKCESIQRGDLIPIVQEKMTEIWNKMSQTFENANAAAMTVSAGTAVTTNNSGDLVWTTDTNWNHNQPIGYAINSSTAGSAVNIVLNFP
nr:hypothetical protein 6 [Candidatus Omnitrophota bacterium]